MIAMAKKTSTAAQWSQAQYEQIFLPEVTPARFAIVIEEGAWIAGFLISRAIDKEWEVENIVVAGPARKRGLGVRLMGELVRLARHRSAKAIFLEVRESNRAARALYTKCEFAVTGSRKGYYRNPDEDAIVYRLDLADVAS